MVKSAEEMLTKCRNDDKKNTLLLGKAAKATHKNMVKENLGIVREFVKEINIIPRNPELLCKSKQESAELGQRIHSRKNKLEYTTFDDFADLDNPETVFFACNCSSGPKIPSGCKGKACIHITMALIKAGKITTRAADRRLSNFHHKKGPAGKNRKQNA